MSFLSPLNSFAAMLCLHYCSFPQILPCQQQQLSTVPTYQVTEESFNGFCRPLQTLAFICNSYFPQDAWIYAAGVT